MTPLSVDVSVRPNAPVAEGVVAGVVAGDGRASTDAKHLTS